MNRMAEFFINLAVLCLIAAWLFSSEEEGTRWADQFLRRMGNLSDSFDSSAKKDQDADPSTVN